MLTEEQDKEYARISEFGAEHGLVTEWSLSFNREEIDTLEKVQKPHRLAIETLHYEIFNESIDLEVSRLEPYPKTWYDLWLIFDQMVQDSGQPKYKYLEQLIDNGFGDFELKTST